MEGFMGANFFERDCIQIDDVLIQKDTERWLDAIDVGTDKPLSASSLPAAHSLGMDVRGCPVRNRSPMRTFPLTGVPSGRC